MRSPKLVVTLLLLIFTFSLAAAQTPCPLSTVSPSVTICTPTNGSTVTSPFQVWAGTTDTAHPVTAMKVYLDFVVVYSVSANVVNTTLSAAAGSHHLTVNAWDSSGTVFKTSLTFTVSGAATGSVTVSPASIGFGNQVVNTTSAAQNVTLSNGTANALSVSAAISGAGFAISNNGCGSTLAANSSCNVAVTFTPTSATASSGSLTITDSPDSGSPHAVALSGTGVNAGSCPPSTVSPSVTVCAPVNGSTVNSPFQVLASTTDNAHPVTAMKVYIDNIGVYSVKANQINTSLTASAGSHGLVINAWDSSGAVFKSTAVSFTVAAGPPPPPVQVSPSTVSFGDQIVNQTSAPQTVTVKNNTTGTLTMGTISASPAQYAVNPNCGTSLGAGSSCQITVTFTPSAAGAVPGTLTINDSDASSPQTVALSGSGVTLSILAVTPASPTIFVGANQQFKATATYSDSTTQDVTTSVTWSSSDTTVATISGTAPNQGLANGVAAGTTTITAALSGVSGTATLTVAPAPASSGVLTFHNDNLRTGQNPNETVLTPANVNVTNFGKLFSYAVDGRIYAQPLYVSNLNINGGLHNVVFVVTENDSVYAFDADGLSSSPLWKRSFINPGAGITTVPSTLGGSNVQPQIGITGTPVIDLATNTLYCVANTDENGTVFWRLHALDILTGADKFGGPVAVTATEFTPQFQLQRPGLLLANGNVYFAFGSNGDHNSWHGFVFAYDASTLLKVGMYNVTPTGNGGGVWQSAGGLGADASGNVYFSSGNGANNVATGGTNISDSFIKLTPGTQLADFFTPFNHNSLDCCDLDLASGGPVLLPDQPGSFPHIMIGGGKTGSLYVMNRDNLGKFNSTSNNIVQTLNGAVGPIYDQPAYWNGMVYIVSSNDVPKAFAVSNGMLSSTAVSMAGASYTFPGASPAISANGTSNGIVWAQNWNNTGSILYAYDANNLGTVLWNSNQNATRDSVGTGEKFMVPTIFNGKVYIGTTSKLLIYGLLH